MSTRAAAWMEPLVRPVGSVTLFAARTVKAVRSAAWPRGEVLRLLHDAGNRSVLLVTVSMAFVGMVLVFQAGFQARRIVGDMTLIGPAYLQLLLREFGPTISALMVAARVGAGIAAELGTMRVTDQVDALRMNGVDPVAWLAAPRLVAVALAAVALALWGCAAAFAAGVLTAGWVFGITPEAFIDFRLTHPVDALTGLVKAASYGLWIPIAAAHAGLGVRGGSREVGRATTRAVVAGSLGVIVLDVLIGGLAVVLFG